MKPKSARTVVFTLGRGRRETGGDYRKATYLFPDGTESQASEFFGLSLFKWLRHSRGLPPDLVVVVGTRSSIWDALLLGAGDEGPAAVEDQVLDAVHRRVCDCSVDGECLAPAADCLEKAFGVPFRLLVVPEGLDHAGQMETLQKLSEAVPERSELHMCVTHGLRHMPMLQMLSAFHLQQIRGVTLAGLYYGALELGVDSKRCPVIELSGAADLHKWSLALHAVSQTGRLSPLADAVGPENEELGNALNETDFRLQANQVGMAAQSARCASKWIEEKALPGAGRLYRESALARLDWAESGELWQQQHLCARQALKIGDFMRCAILCLEALTSRELPAGVYSLDYEARELALKQLKARLAKSSEGRLRDIQKLEAIRNSVAHGSAASWHEVRNLLRDRHELEKFLDRMLRQMKTL
jgi:CRISPR-associated Csx2 family protein